MKKTSTKEYISALKEVFVANADKTTAAGQKAYMKNNFEFFGIKTPVRRLLVKPFLEKAYLPAKSDMKKTVPELWVLPQREFHYFGQELAAKFKKQADEKDIELFEMMVLNNSWWDTVDFIAVHLMGNYFKQHPQKIESYVNKWLAGDNMWLQRCALLFQLKYKHATDTVLLASVIKKLSGSKEFFIKKAIGWVLREYSRTNPEWVKKFVHNNTISNLSKKEALRLMV